MDTNELSFVYFPENYRWSHGLLLALNGAPWGGGEIGEIHRIGLRLRARPGDDPAWVEEWTAAQKCFDAVGSARKTFKVFTRAEGGYHHCQIDNVSIGTAYMWDWLEDVLQPRRS